MRALMYVDEKKMELQELPMPEGEVILRVLGCTVCGTDLKTFLHGHPYFKPPTILGHEFYGRVEKAPADSSFAPGDYVVAAPYGECGVCDACREGLPELCERKDYVETGAFCEYVALSAAFAEKGLIHLEGPAAVYALTEPLACVLTGLEKMKTWPLDRVQVAELTPARRAKLKEWGIPCDSLENCYASGEFNKILVAVNVAALVEEAVKKVKSGGQVLVFAGLPRDVNLSIPGYDLHYRFVSISGCSGYALPAFRKAYEMIQGNPARYQTLITHRFPLEKGQEAMDILARGEAFKVMIEP